MVHSVGTNTQNSQHDSDIPRNCDRIIVLYDNFLYLIYKVHWMDVERSIRKNFG